MEITNDKKYNREHVTIGLLTEWQNLYIFMIIEILGLGLWRDKIIMRNKNSISLGGILKYNQLKTMKKIDCPKCNKNSLHIGYVPVGDNASEGIIAHCGYCNYWYSFPTLSEIIKFGLAFAISCPIVFLSIFIIYPYSQLLMGIIIISIIILSLIISHKFLYYYLTTKLFEKKLKKIIIEQNEKYLFRI